MYIYIHVYMYVYIYIYVYTYIHTYIYIQAHTKLQSIYIIPIYMSTVMYEHACTHANSLQVKNYFCMQQVLYIHTTFHTQIIDVKCELVTSPSLSHAHTHVHSRTPFLSRSLSLLNPSHSTRTYTRT